MSTDEDNINTASIEEMINANLGISPGELAEAVSPETASDNATEEVLKSIDIDALLTDASDDDTAEPIAETDTEESSASPEIIVKESPTDNSDAEKEASTEESNEAITEESAQDMALDDLLSSAMEKEPATADTEPAIEPINEPAAEIEELVADEQPAVEAEETASEVQEISEAESTESIAEENKNTDPELASEIADNTNTDTSEETINVEVEASEPVDNSLPGAEAIQSLETEMAELDSEIQTQIDQFAIQADHLKANIQSELQRVCLDNEQLHEQIKELEQQLLSAEEKIQGFTEIQDKQQVTIHKLILIVKGIRSKISHLYDE